MLRRVLHNSAGAGRSLHTSSLLQAKILASDPIDPICGKILRERGHELVEAAKTTFTAAELMKMIGDFDGLIVRSGTTVTKDVLAAGSKLKVVGRAGVGIDNVDVRAATERGVIVMNTPGGNTTSAAELTLSLIFALMRQVPQASASMKSGKWERSKFMGSECAGKTVGIIGLGRIGREVARWCQAFGMRVVGYDPVLSADVASAEGITPVTLDQLYAAADIITLHCPKTKETANLLCTATFAKMKTGVRIVNVARGGIVNEDDLLVALESGKVGGAALDVFTSEPPPESIKPLLAHPRVIATPHLGASTSEAQVNVARDIAHQLADALENKAFVGVVNAATNLSFLSRPDLAAYTTMAERLGSLHAQLLKGKLGQITLSVQGPLVSDPSVATALRVAMLKGLLTAMMPTRSINWINVLPMAKELGVDVAEQSAAKSTASGYANLVTVVVKTETGARSISASVFSDGEARLVDIDGFRVEVTPKGELLFWSNMDQPGVLSAITKLLAEASINIAFFSLGRKAGGDALGILQTDTAVPEAVLSKLRALPLVKNIIAVSVPGNAAEEDEGAQAGAGHVAGGLSKPSVKPSSPNFGSGPTKKRPGWTAATALRDAAVGRSHRSALGKAKLARALGKTRELLRLPADYHVGIVPGSDTGAYEMAMWSLLGPKAVDSCHWESFGSGWHTDLTKQLKLKEVREFKADYGKLPDLAATSKDNDILFTWNGTTSGVMVPNADWISADRTGLTLCDATSAVFSQPVDFPKCDVTTYSWQKVLGGEGAHGMLILSPRAVARLESYTPPWPMPKVFRMTKKGKFDASIFAGDTINTPSMICVEDYLDALTWAEAEGGVAGLTKRSNANLALVTEFVKANPWMSFLAAAPEQRSNTSICLQLDLSKEKVKALTSLLEKEGVAVDIGSYRDAPPGLRIWGGATVEAADTAILLEWIKWAYHTVA